MATTKAAGIAASLEPEARQAFEDLIADYNEATRVHVPNWRGSINANIAADLVRQGWRKRRLPDGQPP
jgi:hypothetical protein